MDLILPIYDTCRKTERFYWSMMCYAQKPPTVSQNDIPVAQNHHLKMVTQQSKKCHISENEPHIVGDFWLPSQAPNENLNAPMEILGSVDVNQPFERTKWPLHGCENCHHFMVLANVEILTTTLFSWNRGSNLTQKTALGKKYFSQPWRGHFLRLNSR